MTVPILTTGLVPQTAYTARQYQLQYNGHCSMCKIDIHQIILKITGLKDIHELKYLHGPSSIVC